MSSALANAYIVCDMYKNYSKTVSSHGLLLLCVSYILVQTSNLSVHLLLLPCAIRLTLYIIYSQVRLKRLTGTFTPTEDPFYFKTNNHLDIDFFGIYTKNIHLEMNVHMIFYDVSKLAYYGAAMYYDPRVMDKNVFITGVIQNISKIFLNLQSRRMIGTMVLPEFEPFTCLIDRPARSVMINGPIYIHT